MNEFINDLFNLCNKYQFALRFNGDEFKLIQVDNEREHYVFKFETLNLYPIKQFKFSSNIEIVDSF